jgi:hypothetical protein
LPCVGHEPAVRAQLVAPGEFDVVEPATCGELPFGFGRQVLPRPVGIGAGIVIGDVNDRMIKLSANVATAAIGMPPVGAEFERPPLR